MAKITTHPASFAPGGARNFERCMGRINRLQATLQKKGDEMSAASREEYAQLIEQHRAILKGMGVDVEL